MELDIKNLAQQDMNQLVHSLELVSARVFDSVIKLNQTATSNTPEMQLLFEQWLDLIGGEIASRAAEDGKIDPQELSEAIGVTPATILSLALTLHRQGNIKITEIKTEKGPGKNTEACGCLQG